MKVIIILIVSGLVLFGLSSANRQSGDEQTQPGTESTVEDSTGGDQQKSRPDVVRADTLEDGPASVPTTDSENNLSQEKTGSNSRGPGIPLFDFSGAEPSWYTVNDNVMGGVSNSLIVVDPELQRLSFSGDVSLENNGGFASMRSQWTNYNLSAFNGIALRVRGDGNTYRFRIRTEETGFGIAYTGIFTTEAGTWQEVYIPFSEMVPLYRGFVVGIAGPLNPDSIRSFGLMLADKQEGEFSLDVDWINAVAESRVEIKYAANSTDSEQTLDSLYVDG